RRKPKHRRNLAQAPFGYGERNERGGNERSCTADHGQHGSYGIFVLRRVMAVYEEKYEQWPIVYQQVDPTGFGFCGLAFGELGFGHAIPAITRATRSGSNGRKSSIFSPTPIAWIGSPYCSAAATSTPPRAVPSSLVMIS